MNKERQRIEIARACKHLVDYDFKDGRGPVLTRQWFWPKGSPWDGEIQTRFPLYETVINGIRTPNCSIPDYLNDLNAMYEAEGTLASMGASEYTNYVVYLSRIVGWNDATSNPFPILHATPAQRAEAFLRAIGKWEEDPA